MCNGFVFITENTYIQFVLNTKSTNEDRLLNIIIIGTVRETFAVNQLAQAHLVEYGKSKGDFLVDGKVGGADKDYTQIADIPDSYILADDMEYPYGNKLPLWLFGFLY